MTSTITNKYSKDFDEILLNELKQLSNIPTEDFDKTVEKIMKRKCTAKLWWDNKPVQEWDGKQMRDCNYRCCPSTHKARHLFCLVLDRKETGITVTDGFLSAI